MDTLSGNLGNLADGSKRIAHQLLSIGENRVELLMVELQEERERLLTALLLSLGVAVFGLLAGIAVTVIIVVLLWERSPIGALLTLAVLYAVAGGLLYQRLLRLKQAWHMLPATLEQLRKDRACLKETLS